MKPKLLALFLFLSTITLAQQHKAAAFKKPDKGFIKNYGQVVDQNSIPNDAVRYLLNTKGLNVQLRASGFSYDVYERKTQAAPFDWLGYTTDIFKPQNRFQPKDSVQTSLSFHRVDIDFLDTSNDLKIQEYERGSTYYNYYNVPNCQEGITHVPFYKRIVYKNLYRGIDLEFIIPEDQSKPVEYNFKVQPGSNLANIKMQIKGAPVALKNNRLELSLAQGILHETIPKSWIQEDEVQQEVQVNYTQFAANTFGFEVTNALHYKKPLIIDPTPVRLWATYIGGEREENNGGGEVKVNNQGEVLIASTTNSNNFIATSNAHQTSIESNSRSGFITKFSSQGERIWSTYYGNETNILAIDTDTFDNIVAVGMTFTSEGISTPNSHQEERNNDPENYMDGFIVKFDTKGIRLWGSYYSGEDDDLFTDVAIDSNNSIFAVGYTHSNSGIATPGAFRNSGMLIEYDESDPFIVKFNESGVQQWGTYHGGSRGYVIEVDSKGDIYIGGEVFSSEIDSGIDENIATPESYQSVFGGGSSDSFLAKFNTNGERLWSTIIGGERMDRTTGIAIDKNNNVVICGMTESQDYKTVNAFQNSIAGEEPDTDAFLAKFTGDGAILWNTLYGSIEGDGASSVTIGEDNSIILAGGTGGKTDFVTPDAFQSTNPYEGTFLAKFDSGGTRVWCTYYSGNGFDYSLDVTISKNGEIYFLGSTKSSQDIATPGAYQENIRGFADSFLVKFKDCESSIRASATPYLCEGEDIVFTASGGTSYTWSGPNGFSSTLQNPVITAATPVQSGTYSVFVTGDSGCDDSRTFEVVISAQPIANPAPPLEACEDFYNTGISSAFNTASVRDQILNGQTDKVIKYFDEAGNELPSPLPNPFTNTTPNKQTITARVYNVDNPQCYAETSFDLIVNPLPQVNAVADLVSCDTDTDGITTFDSSNLRNDLIGSQPNLEVSLIHEDGQQLTEPLPQTLTNKVPHEETITAQVTNTLTGCTAATSFKLIVSAIPNIGDLPDLIGCDDNNDGISEYFNTAQIETLALQGQTGMEVTYYDASGNLLPAPLPDPYTNSLPHNETLTVRVSNTQSGCYAETTLNLITSAQPQINKPAPRFACDAGNGYSSFDLTDIEQEVIGSQTGLTVQYSDESGNALTTPLSANFQNTTAWSQRINIRVENADNARCFSETYLDLKVNELPQLSIEEGFVICDNEPGLQLSRSEHFDFWQWEDPAGTSISSTAEAYLTQEGSYTLTVGELQNGILCTNSYTLTLERSAPPTITTVDFADWSDHNFIEVTATGDGVFEYSIDGEDYQDSNYFPFLKGGVYTVSVRDKAGCGLASTEVVLVDYPKVFTPNGDGYHDYWQVEGIEAFPDAQIFIFDRYGKLLKQLSPQENGWDGSFTNQNLPSADYWFKVDLGNGRIYKNHFTLKR